MTILPLGATDCHAHIFRAAGPFAQGSRYRPDRDAPLEDYLDLLDRHAVSAGILVQVSFLGTDNTLMLDALARCPERLRGVAVVDPETPPERLSALYTMGVRGVRLNLIGRPVPDLALPTWQEHLSRAAAAGLHVEVQCEGEAWEAVLPPLARSAARIVVDHFGRPASADVARDRGFQALLDHAASGRVWVKLSAPYRFAGDPRRAADLLLQRAGPERLVWGSDWPWTQNAAGRDYGVLKARLGAWIDDPGVVKAILEDNPRRLYWG